MSRLRGPGQVDRPPQTPGFPTGLAARVKEVISLDEVDAAGSGADGLRGPDDARLLLLLLRQWRGFRGQLNHRAHVSPSG